MNASRLALLALVTTACGGDLIAQAHAQCAAEPAHCADKTASGTLYLDTGNLPSVSGAVDRIVLCATPVDSVCASERLEVTFEGGPLAADIDPGAADRGGWKVRFEGLATSWLEPPGQLALSARLRALEFVDDSGDALSVSLAVE